MNQLEKQKMIAEYKESIKDKTLDELKAIEQELIKEAEATDEEVKNTTFPTPKENYKEVCLAIRLILNKITVDWRFTQAMISMYDFWNPEKREKEIPYPMLDGTLRTLGERQFTGYEEWAAVVAINKYFEPLREKYIEVSERVYDVAMKHSEVMDRMKLIDPETQVPDKIEVGEEKSHK